MDNHCVMPLRSFIIQPLLTEYCLFATYCNGELSLLLYVHLESASACTTRNFVIASAVVWGLAVAAGILLLSDKTVHGVCSSSSSSSGGNITRYTWKTISQFTLPLTVPYFVVSSIPNIVTLVILIDHEPACYIKRKSTGDHSDTNKALVELGRFLMIIQGINAFAQIGVPLLAKELTV